MRGCEALALYDSDDELCGAVSPQPSPPAMVPQGPHSDSSGEYKPGMVWGYSYPAPWLGQGDEGGGGPGLDHRYCGERQPVSGDFVINC
jgi:hypothetical protein